MGSSFFIETAQIWQSLLVSLYAQQKGQLPSQTIHKTNPMADHGLLETTGMTQRRKYFPSASEQYLVWWMERLEGLEGVPLVEPGFNVWMWTDASSKVGELTLKAFCVTKRIG